MTRAELCAEWQRRKAEALETGATAPVAKLADVILQQRAAHDNGGSGDGAER